MRVANEDSEASEVFIVAWVERVVGLAMLPCWWASAQCARTSAHGPTYVCEILLYVGPDLVT